MPLNVKFRRISDVARELSRSATELKAVGQLAQIQDDAAFSSLLPQAFDEVERFESVCRRQDSATEEGERAARQEVELAERAVEGGRRLAEAARKVDAYLVRGGNHQSRISDGRKSLTSFNLDKHLSLLAEVQARRQGSQLKVSVGQEQRKRIQDALTGGQRGWVTYVFQEMQRDLQLAIHEAWVNLDEDLPVPAPPPAALKLPWDQDHKDPNPWWIAPELPEFESSWPMEGLLWDLMRTIRQQLFSMMMMLGLAAAIVGASSDKQITGLLALLLVVPVGLFVVQRDRTRRMEELVERGRRESQSELQRWVESRLDRTANKMRDVLIYQHQVLARAEWVRWYRKTVQPYQAQAAERAQQSRANLERARQQRQDLQRRQPRRELERFLSICAEA